MSGYRPHHQILENYQTSGLYEFTDVDALAPGHSALARVWFVTPDIYPGTLWPGRRIGVFEGSRQVGFLRVLEVLNPVLAGTPESFARVWRPLSDPGGADLQPDD